MEFVQSSRPRRHSGAYAHSGWNVVSQTGLTESSLSVYDIPRPKSAPPVENRWLSLPVSEDYASDDTQSEAAPSDSSSSSSSSSDESSPPSTRPSSPPFAFEKKSLGSREVYIREDEYGLSYDEEDDDETRRTQRLPRRLAEPEESVPRRTLYVVLERASMEICRAAPASGHPRHGKVKPTLLTCDDHQGLLVRMGREVSDARPDITHQCLLTLLDSPLNKTGLLKIFVHTTQGLLIEVHPDVRIPRTYKRYSGLMVQLLQQGEIRGASDSQVLMRVLKEPITHYLPRNATKIDARTTTHARTLVRSATSRPLAVFVGAMAKGPDDFAEDVVDQKISLSRFPLSASVVLGKVCCAMEDLYGIL